MSEGVIKVFVAGEGKADIGNAGDLPPYNEPLAVGVVHALLGKVATEQLPRVRLEFVGGLRWKDIRKFRSGEHRSEEERNVLGAALQASEKNAEVLAFVRDRDGYRERQADIERGIAAVTSVRVVGGMAVETIEAWVLAALGDSRAEDYGDPKKVLHGRGVVAREQLVEVLEAADLAAVPVASSSLRSWLERSKTVLSGVP